MLHYKTFGPLEGPFIGPSDSEIVPRPVLVLLHGWGADGNDLSDLAGPLQQMIPDLALWCPNAPHPCSANPMGREWFALTQAFFDNPQSALSQITQMSDQITASLSALCDSLAVVPSDIILGGFSQGGMMSLQIATSGAFEAAGFASLSGALIGKAGLNGGKNAPILLAHGTADEVVPFAASEQAQDHLQSAGYDVQLISRPGLGHGIDQEIVQALGQFCHEVTR
ncbi:MAG: alpha/beta hydrolase [Candidatus Puniceispirillaceae bacterium]